MTNLLPPQLQIRSVCKTAPAIAGLLITLDTARYTEGFGLCPLSQKRAFYAGLAYFRKFLVFSINPQLLSSNLREGFH